MIVSKLILIFGGIVMSIGIGALIIDYIQKKLHHEK